MIRGTSTFGTHLALDTKYNMCSETGLVPTWMLRLGMTMLNRKTCGSLVAAGPLYQYIEQLTSFSSVSCHVTSGMANLRLRRDQLHRHQSVPSSVLHDTGVKHKSELGSVLAEVNLIEANKL